MCQSPPILDLRNIEFAEFVALIFNHPIAESPQDTSSGHPLWDLDLDYLIRFDPERHAQH
jgi:hypothetical protein